MPIRIIGLNALAFYQSKPKEMHRKKNSLKEKEREREKKNSQGKKYSKNPQSHHQQSIKWNKFVTGLFFRVFSPTLYFHIYNRVKSVHSRCVHSNAGETLSERDDRVYIATRIH